jgi:hypothetical protein
MRKESLKESEREEKRGEELAETAHILSFFFFSRLRFSCFSPSPTSSSLPLLLFAYCSVSMMSVVFIYHRQRRTEL